MLSFVSRLFSHQSVMKSLQQSALQAANKFAEDGIRQHYTRWSNHIYEEGISIKDEKKFEAYTKMIKNDIDALERQAAIHKMYANVE